MRDCPGCGAAYERNWPDPSPEMLESPEFGAVWAVIKGWDIGNHHAYAGRTGAIGNHVREILDALAGISALRKLSN